MNFDFPGQTDDIRSCPDIRAGRRSYVRCREDVTVIAKIVAKRDVIALLDVESVGQLKLIKPFNVGSCSQNGGCWPIEG